MLGSVPLSVKALGDDTILLAGVAEMDGLGVQTSVGVGILVGETSISANLTQTSTGTFISAGASSEISANFTETSVACRVKGSTQEIDLVPNFTQTTTGIGVFVGTSTQDLNFTQTSAGEKLWESLSTAEDTEEWSELSTTASTESWSDLTTTTNTEEWTDFTR